MHQTLADYFKTQPVVKAWIFGSVARGEETPLSDVDILVVLDHTQPIGLKFYGMWNDLEQLLDRSVDLVTESSLADFARESVERDKILIYERAAQTAERMKKRGYDTDEICKITGLSREEIESL